MFLEDDSEVACSRLNVYKSPQVHMLNSSSQYNGVRMWRFGRSLGHGSLHEWDL